MGRKGWRRREKSAIQQAFIECQVRAEHMVSSNRCCEGNKKEMEYEFLPQDKRDRDISTVSSILDPDILTLFPKHVSMKSRSQQPGASRNILAASVCVSMRKHVWGGKEREGEGICGYRDGMRGKQRILPCVKGPFLMCLINHLLTQCLYLVF